MVPPRKNDFAILNYMSQALRDALLLAQLPIGKELLLQDAVKAKSGNSAPGLFVAEML
jgi:hypothetical protein